MVLIKSKSDREIALLEELEQQIKRGEKRRRIARIVAGAAAIVVLAVIATGHAATRCHQHRHACTLLGK